MNPLLKRISETELDENFFRKWLIKINDIVLALFIGEKVLKYSPLTLQEIMIILIWIFRLDPDLNSIKDGIEKLVKRGDIIMVRDKYRLSRYLLEKLDEMILGKE